MGADMGVARNVDHVPQEDGHDIIFRNSIVAPFERRCILLYTIHVLWVCKTC